MKGKPPRFTVKPTCTGKMIPVVRVALKSQKCIENPISEKIDQPKKIADLMTKHYGCSLQEHVVSIALDTKLNVLALHEVSIGGLEHTTVDPRTLFQGLLAAGASAFAVMHNHPSGDPNPSLDDRLLTKRLSDGAKILNLRFVDHVVVGSNGRFVSIRDENPESFTDLAGPA